MSQVLTEKQKENLNFFKDNLDKYLQDNLLKDKFVVIHEKTIVKAFDSFEAALSYAVSTLPNDEFIIQEVISDSDTVNFLYSASKSA